MSKLQEDGHIVLPVILRLIQPIVLVPLVRAVVPVRLEIDQQHLGIREIIPQQVIGNPSRGRGCVVRGPLGGVLDGP